MKSIIYKNPVISAILFNLVFMFLGIYLIKHNNRTYVAMAMPFTGILNGKILSKGINLNSTKKTYIIVSLVVMMCVILSYVYNMLLKLRI